MTPARLCVPSVCLCVLGSVRLWLCVQACKSVLGDVYTCAVFRLGLEVLERGVCALPLVFEFCSGL